MKLTPSQREIIQDYIDRRDWESVHQHYDSFVCSRLLELDSEFLEEINALTKDSTFWYS